MRLVLCPVLVGRDKESRHLPGAPGYAAAILTVITVFIGCIAARTVLLAARGRLLPADAPPEKIKTGVMQNERVAPVSPRLGLPSAGRPCGCLASGAAHPAVRRKLAGQHGAVTRRAVEREPPAEGLGPVDKADQSRAAGERRAAYAVVRVRGPDCRVVSLDGQRDLGGLGVLGRVGERFRDNVIDGDLDRLGEPAQPGGDAQADRDRRPAGKLAH